MSRKEIVSDWFYQYKHDVYNFLVYYTGKRDPEDLVQEVFIKAIKGLNKFDGKSSPKTWLFSIARNVAIDDIRKNKRRGMDQNVDLDEAYNIGHHVTPDAIVQEDEEKQQLYRAINSLKSNYREVIILRAIKELNVSETASVLNWSNQKVRTTYSRALKALGEVQGGFQNE
ncbi:RNA polymerase sigma factor [Alkalibacillus haloalkaliphilus]|uniref:RNA polymerase sigma factor n=1 Tax=Alkalibacillus haloalkaliphilus TaxID=94136 RepID=UPI000302CE11|nr:RNA polymerase sigma factor [Alkalibacillus haloalkaliphilus]